MAIFEADARVVETGKNVVAVHCDHVVKSFKRVRGSQVRMRRETVALRRLADMPGVPSLLESSPRDLCLRMSFIRGTPLIPQVPVVPDEFFKSLRELLEAMLERGVARHSLPARDIIVRRDGSAGLGDFE